MDQRPIKIDPDECIPVSHLQLQFNECQRCIEQDVQIQSLQIENASLRQMIEKLKTELAKFQYKPEQFDLTAVPLMDPILPELSMTPQPEKCIVCTAEYMTNDGQKHICNGENEISCEYCNEFFASTLDLIDHSNACHNEIKTFHCCTKCPEMFSMAQLLQFHDLSHPQLIAEPIHICNICNKHFTSKEQLNEHQQKAHKRIRQTNNSKKQSPPQLQPRSKTTIKIKIDPPTMRLRKEPIKPMKSLKLKPFECDDCSECFTTRKKLLGHKKREHRRKTPRSYECYVCKLECKSVHKTKIHLKKHLRTEKCVVCQECCTKNELEAHICAGLQSMDCGYCQQTFASTKSLLQHLQDCKSEKFSYECGKCPKYFLMEFLTDLHRKNHKDNEPPKVLYCTICSSSFNCPRQLKLHRERHDESRDYLCDTCGKGFLCAVHLRHHKRTHNKKSMKCTQCDFTCSGKTAYNRHLLRHQNIKFVCDICGLHLSTTAKLAIHKKIHTRTEADRTHACSVCEKKFFTSKSCRSHLLKAHTQTRFECDLCDQSYKYKGDLNKHKRATHSAGYLYICRICSKRFPQQYELDHHLFEHATAPEMEQLEPFNRENPSEKSDDE